MQSPTPWRVISRTCRSQGLKPCLASIKHGNVAKSVTNSLDHARTAKAPVSATRSARDSAAAGPELSCCCACAAKYSLQGQLAGAAMRCAHPHAQRPAHAMPCEHLASSIHTTHSLNETPATLQPSEAGKDWVERLPDEMKRVLLCFYPSQHAPCVLWPVKLEPH